MAASPETAKPPESSDTHSSPHPPSSPGLHPTQESPSLTTAAPLEMANPNHATPVPPAPAERSRLEHPEVDQPPPTPTDEAEPPLSHPPAEAAPAASPAFEAIPTEKLASPPPLPEDVAVAVSPEVAASAPSPSPSPSPQIVGASLEDAPQPPSLPRTPPATTGHASTDPSTTEGMAMASQEEAARPSPAPESMHADSHTAPAPLAPPMECGPEGLLPQRQPRPPSPEMGLPLCGNSEPTQPTPSQPCHPAECTDASPDATVDEIVEGRSEKAPGSLPLPEATDGDMDTTPGMLPALEIGPEEMLQQQQPRPPCSEMAPSRGENLKPAQALQPPPPPESTYGWLNAAMNEVSAVASEEATPLALEATDGEMGLEFGAEMSLWESVQTSTTSRMEAEPCSLEMAPPGFEDFKSQWLPLSPPILAESTHNAVLAAAADPVGSTLGAATESLSALEAIDVETDISPGLLPLLKSGAEGQSQQPLLGSCSPVTEAAPSSPDMPPPGFENCKSSWLPLPTLPPLTQTTYALQDVASTKAVTVAFVEKACSVLALEATDVETDTERCQLTPLESGTGSSLQGPLPRLPSPMMQASATNEAMHVTSDEAPQSSPALEANLDVDDTPALAPPLESEAGKSLPLEPPIVPSHVAHHTVCSLGTVPSGSENVESSQLPLPPPAVLPLDQNPDTLADAGTKTVMMEEVCHPLPVTGATEEANGSTLPPALENGCEGPLPHLEPQASSAAVHATPASSEIAPTGFENSESSQQTSAQTSATMPMIVESEKTNLPLSPFQAKDTDMESETQQQLPLKSEGTSLPQPEQCPSSPSVKDTTCSPEAAPPGYENLDSLEQLPPPPPLSTKFGQYFSSFFKLTFLCVDLLLTCTEMGQMVCGCCRQLLAYPRGAVHVECYGCCTINLVLEEHQIGKVSCGQCDTLLMYPFGAPAVKCSNCHFVTEIGERNVRPRISMEQSASPHPQEVAHQS
ncbi:Protein LOL5 [Dichanthelium oligosanthes]|uniref:Protein LOL5 n=1 Tax=Dichanthelium oligosanthes TaxID=888268 RepID=A0A1E5VMU3_9POAL|nr:Protein LOL5 [Dichanthelium oligosanthes]